MLRIIQKRKYFYLLSGSLVILSILALSIWGLRFGIDFTGGTQMKVGFSRSDMTKAEIENSLRDLSLSSLSVQDSENDSMIIRYSDSSDEINEKVLEKIRSLDPEAQELQLDFIGSSVSSQLKRSAILAVLLAVVGIAAYIAWAFRKVSRPVSSWKYGLGAVIALAHDILITTGIFAVLGRFAGVEVGVPFVAALLTILGYSVNDTIVVYDRTRENLLHAGSRDDFEEVVNRSLNETLARSINTSLTVIIVLLAIVFFGGQSIKDFSLALLIGVTFGTYSSIYVASALLVTIYKLQLKK